jgi:hypothetical protein
MQHADSGRRLVCYSFLHVRGPGATRYPMAVSSRNGTRGATPCQHVAYLASAPNMH